MSIGFHERSSSDSFKAKAFATKPFSSSATTHPSMPPSATSPAAPKKPSAYRPVTGMDQEISKLLDSTTIEYDQVQRLITQCRSEAMRGSVEHQVALEILVPMSVDVMPEVLPHAQQVKADAEDFFGGWLNPHATRSDVSKKIDVIGQALDDCSFTDSPVAQQLTQDLVTNVADFVTTGVQNTQIRPSLRNTCYFDAAINILLRNPQILNAVTAAQPSQSDWHEVQRLLLQLSQAPNGGQSSQAYVALHHALTARLAPPPGQQAHEAQQDAMELVGLILEGLDVSVGHLNNGELFGHDPSAASAAPAVLLEQSGSPAAHLPIEAARLHPHRLAGVCIHAGAAVSSNDNGLSASSGHYYSLVKTAPSSWRLYSYHRELERFDRMSLNSVMRRLAQNPEFSQAHFKGVYVR